MAMLMELEAARGERRPDNNVDRLIIVKNVVLFQIINTFSYLIEWLSLNSDVLFYLSNN